MVRRVVLFLAVMVITVFAYQAGRAVVQAAGLTTIASTDMDSNGRADFVVYRPSEGRFFVLQAPNYNSAFSFGSTSATVRTDTLLAPNDYNGDGKIDSAVWRPETLGSGAPVGTWTVALGPTFTSSTSIQWGLANDTPLPADWDGDGRLDVAVFRPSESKLYVLQAPSYNTAFTITWGIPGDFPMPADLDSDGRIDFAVYRPSERKILVLQGGSSFKSAFALTFGEPTQTFLPGDYDGDGKTDVAVYTPATLGPSDVVGTWTIVQGGTGFKTQFAKVFGTPNDLPTPGDFDGDGRLDIAVFRRAESRFFVLQAGTGYTTAFSVAFGAPGDIPISARNPVQNDNF